MNRFYKLFVAALIACLPQLNWAQTSSYTVSYTANGGNPLGLNADGDITTTGWTNILAGSQNANLWSANQTLPFAFQFFGQPVTQYKVSANGLLTFDVAGALPAGNNLALPAANLPSNTICGFWDAFTDAPPIGANDVVWAKTFGTAPNRQHWLYWFSYELGSPNASFVYFAIVLEETSNRVYIVDTYGTNTPLLSSTIGVQRNTTTAVTAGNNIPQAVNGTATTDNDFWTFQPITLFNDDAGVTALTAPVLNGAGVAGNQAVQLTLRNFGGNALTSATVNWQVAGVAQTPFNYSGSLASLTNTPVNVGNYNFPTGISRIKAWTSNPNGVADPNNPNDTLNAYFCTPLSGTYTVGTPTSDFLTPQEAALALTNCGIAGNVIFNVAPGTYAGQVRIPAINTAANRTVTFNGGGAATLTHNGTGVNGIATVSLEGADYVTFNGFTIATTASINGWAILLRDTANWNSFTNNNIQATWTSGILNTCGLVASASFSNRATAGNNANFTLIQNNVFTGGEEAIRMTGLASPRNRQNRILNNSISGYDDYAVFVADQDSIFVNNNQVFDVRNTVDGRGFGLLNIMNFDVVGNNLKTVTASIIVQNANTLTTPTRTGRVQNNMAISDLTFAFVLNTTAFVNFYHNTGKSGLAALNMIASTNQVRVKNNILYSTADVALTSTNTTAPTELNYNLYFTENGTNLISYNSLNYPTLAAWQAAPLALDANSLSGNPTFASSNDLHVEGFLAYNSGATNTGVANDIDGQARPANGGYDMGADEYQPPTNDAGVTAMVSPAPPFNPGFNNISVRVRNFGVSPINTVQVKWTLNGVFQTPINYNGAPIAPRTEVTMALAGVNLPATPSTFKFWTNLPNGAQDDRINNDTFETYTCTPLAGAYTVGAGGDFATVNEAAEALTNCGITAPVVFNLQAGTHQGYIHLPAITGASAINTITFDGGNVATTTLTYDGSNPDENAVIDLNGADYIRVRNLKLKHTGSAPAWGVLLTNAANHNIIEGTTVEMVYMSGISDVIGIVAAGSNTNDFAEGDNANFNIIQNNTITGGEMGIHLEGANGSAAGTNYLKNYGNQILNNNISNVDDFGIYLDDQDSIIVAGNRINDVRDINGDGINAFDLMNFVFANNQITVPDWGVYILGANRDTVPAFGAFVNNMIISTTNDYGFYSSNMGATGIYHNTLQGAPAMYVLGQTPASLDIRNNIFYSPTGFAFQCGSNITMANMNYNLFHVEPTVTNAIRYNTTNYANLAAWQASIFGYDANSRQGNPVFVSATDLHVRGGLANDAGTNSLLFPVPVDIDNQTRPAAGSTIVDIGADEFSIFTNDATAVGLLQPVGNACGSATQTVRVSFRNLGTTPITSMPIEVIVSGAGSGTLSGTYTGNLANGALDSLTLGTINTSAGGTFVFTIITQLSADGNLSNDTTVVSFPVRALNALTPVNASVCAGNSASISATPAIGLAWYTAATGGSPVFQGSVYNTPTINAPAVYYVEATGCSASRTAVSVSLASAPVVSAGSDQDICQNQPATLTSSLTGMYMWSTGATTQQITVGTAATYTLTYTDPATRCVATDDVIIGILPVPSISNTVTPISCAGNSNGGIDLTLTGGSPAFTFVWSNGATTEDLTGLADGTYTVSISDNNACGYTYGVSLNEPDTLSLDTVIVTDVICFGDSNGVINLEPIGGTLPYTFIWNNGVTTEDFAGCGVGTFTTTITDANGCTVSNSSFVNGASQLLISADSVVNESQDLGGGIYISPTGGVAPYLYLWSTGATTQDLTGLVAGTYSVQIFDSLGCTNTDTFVVLYTIPTALTQNGLVEKVSIFPNPTAGLVNVQLNLTTAAEVQMMITNSIGQQISQQQLGASAIHNRVVDFSAYPAGVYTIQLTVANDKVITTKIVVAK